MSSNVVFGICQALAQKEIAALRFNFRGVRNSGGEYGDGIGEQDDVRAAIAFALATPEIDVKTIHLRELEGYFLPSITPKASL